jgi:hypothetical protein
LKRNDLINILNLYPKSKTIVSKNCSIIRNKDILNMLQNNVKKNKLMNIMKNMSNTNLSEQTFHTISPNSIYRRLWDILQFICCLYTILSITLRVGFMSKTFNEFLIPWLLFDYIIDLFYIIDMIGYIRFFSFYIDDDLIIQPKKIWKHYYTSLFLFDFICLLPIDLFAFLIPSSIFTVWELWNFLRLNKLLRLIRFFNYLKNIESLLIYLNIHLDASLIRIFKLLLITLLGTHIFACCW